jgi:Leucine-rich repeat (LRR) protein
MDFSNNNITGLGEYTIRKWMIVSLKHLNISNNAIRTISARSFIGQSGLRVVDLSSNELEHISEETFMYTPTLEWLSLANNKKLNIPDDTSFLRSRNLKVLHLESCGIHRIPLSSFADLIELRELYLSHNKITSLEMGSRILCQPLIKVLYLDLSYNNLGEVPQALTQLPRLEDLNMRYNKLSNVSDILLVERKVKLLNISDNPWRCLCEVCDWSKVCDNVSCQIDVCGGLGENGDTVHCASQPNVSTVNEPSARDSVTLPYSYQLQQDTVGSTLLNVWNAVSLGVGALCTVLSVLVFRAKHLANKRVSHSMDAEHSVPLTNVTALS